MKLTKAQWNALQQVLEANDKGQSFYAVSYYKPMVKLKELELVENAKISDSHWRITDKGRALLKDQT